jgi:signal transduction histidine kinase
MENLEDLVAERTSDLEFANTELARANAELADTMEELADLSKEKDAFLAVLTHDMRTPLTSIKGYASVLRDRELPFEQQQHIAKIILRSEENLLEIVNNILEIEKLQSGTPVLLEHETFDLALSARSVIETLRAQAGEKEIALEYDKVPSPIMVEADRQKMERVMTNLVSNAIKYTPNGGSVAVTTAVNGRDALFSVSDTGYGIPPDEIPLIFDRYSRVKGHQQLAIGTGLGLAVVKTLVEAHHGDISVESEVDVGSTFTVRFPINPNKRAKTKKGPGG